MSSSTVAPEVSTVSQASTSRRDAAKQLQVPGVDHVHQGVGCGGCGGGALLLPIRRCRSCIIHAAFASTKLSFGGIMFERGAPSLYNQKHPYSCCYIALTNASDCNGTSPMKLHKLRRHRTLSDVTPVLCEREMPPNKLNLSKWKHAA